MEKEKLTVLETVKEAGVKLEALGGTKDNNTETGEETSYKCTNV
jgi:hypothetical protein